MTDRPGSRYKLVGQLQRAACEDLSTSGRWMAAGGGGVGETDEALAGILMEWGVGVRLGWRGGEGGRAGGCKQSLQQTLNKGWEGGP